MTDSSTPETTNPYKSKFDFSKLNSLAVVSLASAVSGGGGSDGSNYWPHRPGSDKAD